MMTGECLASMKGDLLVSSNPAKSMKILFESLSAPATGSQFRHGEGADRQLIDGSAPIKGLRACSMIWVPWIEPSNHDRGVN
jgi:hypothetical protein